MDKHDTITEAMKKVLEARKFIIQLKKMKNTENESLGILKVEHDLKFAYNTLERLWQIAK